MERAKQLGKIDARCILETAGHLIDHASRVTYELRGVAIAIHLNGVDSCQRLCDSLGDLRHDIDVAIGKKIGVFYKAQPTYNPQMSEGEAYDKGVRKDQLTGSYGDFSPRHVKSDGSRYPTDIVYFKTAESEGAVYHPTQKPVELGRYLIRTYTNPGDIVLDNACGSGSFCVAAVLEGRSFIGIEKNEDVALFKKRPVDYIDICNQRIKEAKRTFEAEQQAIS